MSLKQKIRNNELTIGTWLSIGNEIIAEIASSVEFDWIAIDIEHSPIDFTKLQNLIRIIELNDCVPLVRVAENNPTHIKRVLDCGAKGLIMPMVNTKDDVISAYDAIYYEPKEDERNRPKQPTRTTTDI